MRARGRPCAMSPRPPDTDRPTSFLLSLDEQDHRSAWPMSAIAASCVREVSAAGACVGMLRYVARVLRMPT